MPTKIIKLSFSKEIWEIINKDLKLLGNTESQRIQNLITSSLILKNYDSRSQGQYQNINYEVDALGDMMTTTLEILDEKKIITAEKWKDRMHEKVMKAVDNFNP